MAVGLVIALSWLFIFIVLLYWVSGNRHILFKQQRTGLNMKPFVLFKFRTLKEDASLPLEARRFRLGDILRRISLDELPQIWNVLKGEMSFIGPRPLPVAYLDHFSDREKQRFLLKPGITGFAQVNGRHSISWQKKIEYDLYYMQHVSFLLDCRIVVKTILLLLSFKNDVSLQEEKFNGNT